LDARNSLREFTGFAERAENHTLRLPELTGYLSSDD